MKPTPFDYSSPHTVGEAVALLADEEREAKALAGGQSLIPMLNMRLARPELLVDITRIPELGRLRVDASGALRIGAAVRQSRAAADALARDDWPLLAAAVERIGHPQIRGRGTVCGSLAHHDPAAELPAVALALDAAFEVTGPEGTRTVAATDFFVATFATALEPGELLTEVVFPPLPDGHGWAWEEQTRRHGDFATVGVAVVLERGPVPGPGGGGGADAGAGTGTARGAASGTASDTVSAARVVFCGVDSVPLRLRAAEDALVGSDMGEAALAAAARAASEGLTPSDDVHATAEHRRESAAHLLTRACVTAWERSR